MNLLAGIDDITFEEREYFYSMLFASCNIWYLINVKGTEIYFVYDNSKVLKIMSAHGAWNNTNWVNTCFPQVCEKHTRHTNLNTCCAEDSFHSTCIDLVSTRVVD